MTQNKFTMTRNYLLANCSNMVLHNLQPNIKDIKKEFAQVHISLSEWESLTEQDCINLGFGMWDEDPAEALYLIPGYLYTFIPEGLKLQTIFGAQVVAQAKQANLDNECRFGALAYGLVFKR